MGSKVSNEPERQAFVDAILAEPAVETHRLIFADWLEEHGDLHKAEGLRTLPGLAGVWSSDWGKDQYGTWCAFTIKDVTQKMRWIEPGIFWMGSSEDEYGRLENEGPRHQVELTQGFWLADTPCTQAMWQAVMGDNPSELQDPRCPVEKINVDDCHAFIARVCTLIHGLKLVLPTEAQWEYACRAGREEARYRDDLDAIAWYEDNSQEGTHHVGEKLPNGWGLFDMLGNVWEWCQDGLRQYTWKAVIDPIGPTDSTPHRVIRGASWCDDATEVRAACRYYPSLGFCSPDLGFRCSSSG